MVIILVAAAIAIGIAVAIAQAKAERERTARLGALAAEKGWSFAPERDRDFPGRFRQFEVFTRGHTRMAYNTMRGAMPAWGASCPFQTGDYRYSITTSTGKSTTTRVYQLSYMVVAIPLPGVPDVTIRPEGFMDSLVQAIGFDDIDFEDAEFSRMFMVKSKDRRFAYDLCHPRMIEHLKERYARGPAIVIAQGTMCFFTENRRWEPSEFTSRLNGVREFFQWWPDHVVRELGGEPKGAGI